MSWDEFKAEIDRQLAAAGKDGTVQIRYTDIGCDDPEVDARAIADNVLIIE
jgi:hypothetical protein